jgi:hypothetical protein
VALDAWRSFAFAFFLASVSRTKKLAERPLVGRMRAGAFARAVRRAFRLARARAVGDRSWSMVATAVATRGKAGVLRDNYELPQGPTPPPGTTLVGQTFRYTAVGGETTFAAVLPHPRPVGDNHYNAFASGGGLAFQTTFDCPVSAFTNLQFTVNCGAALTAGDVVILEIVDLT